MERISQRSNEIEVAVKTPGVFVFRVNGERTDPRNIRSLQCALHRVAQQRLADARPCQWRATANLASSMMGTGYCASPFFSRSGEDSKETWPTARLW